MYLPIIPLGVCRFTPGEKTGLPPPCYRRLSTQDGGRVSKERYSALADF
jgi:hypothetical protein